MRLLLVQEVAAADGEGTACSEASDERCAASLAGVDGRGTALLLFFYQDSPTGATKQVQLTL